MRGAGSFERLACPPAEARLRQARPGRDGHAAPQVETGCADGCQPVEIPQPDCRLSAPGGYRQKHLFRSVRVRYAQEIRGVLQQCRVRRIPGQLL